MYIYIYIHTHRFSPLLIYVFIILWGPNKVVFIVLDVRITSLGEQAITGGRASPKIQYKKSAANMFNNWVAVKELGCSDMGV